MKANALVKKQARQSLRGKWGVFSAAFLAVIAVLAFVSAIETFYVVFNIYGLSAKELMSVLESQPYMQAVVLGIQFLIIAVYLFSLPLLTGTAKMSMDCACGRKISCEDFLCFFTRRKFLNTLCFNLGLYIRKLAWLVICILPCVICIGVASIYSRSLGQLGVVLLYIAGIALLIAGLIAYIFISAKYFLSQYLYAGSDEKRRLSEPIRTSIKYMKGNHDKYFKLVISFIPWLALSFFILPMFYTYPYINVSFANSARWLIKLGKEKERAEAFTANMPESLAVPVGDTVC